MTFSRFWLAPALLAAATLPLGRYVDPAGRPSQAATQAPDAAATESAARAPLEVLRVIESFPEDDIGEWRAGGMSFLATADTKFDFDNEPSIGVVAEIDYIIRDGVNVAVQIEPRKRVPVLELNDGPYVRWVDDNTAEVLSICRGEVERSQVEVESTLELFDPCAPGRRIARIDRAQRAIAKLPQAVFEAPERVFAVSDVEGFYPTLRGLLTAAGVLDLEGRWAYGSDHLVFNGDTVDRGDAVTETLWAIRTWQQEAEAAGGRVHFLLGNHEAKLINGWTDDAHLKYHYVADRMGLLIEELYGPDTELGRWIRSSPTVVRIGELLFVHAGFAPSAAAERLTIDGWNERVRDRFDRAPNEATRRTDPIWGRTSPLWYRGYFEGEARGFGPRPSVALIDAQLAHFGAKHMIVGHTRVETIRAIYPEARVIGTNVRWRKAKQARGLLWEQGRFWQVDARGRRTKLD